MLFNNPLETNISSAPYTARDTPCMASSFEGKALMLMGTQRGFSSFLPRLLRCQDVIGNQALALRKRWLVSSLETHQYDGAYWGIGTEIDGYPHHAQGYSDTVLARLRAVRTDLDAFRDDEQLVLMNHGWLLADAALRSYVSVALPNPLPNGALPSAALLDEAAALRALADSDRRVPLGRGER
jgi:NTE family protein